MPKTCIEMEGEMRWRIMYNIQVACLKCKTNTLVMVMLWCVLQLSWAISFRLFVEYARPMMVDYRHPVVDHQLNLLAMMVNQIVNFFAILDQ